MSVRGGNTHRKYLRYNQFTRNRYSYFKEFLVGQAARIDASARGIRDVMRKLGASDAGDVLGAADSTPTDIGVITTGEITGGASISVTSGVVSILGVNFTALGFVDGDTVEVTYGGADYPTEFDRYIGVASTTGTTDMTVTPSPPDAALAATATVLVTKLNILGRE